MAKDKLTDYDSTASNNLDVGGISIAEGMLPSNVNNAIREQMSHLADAFGAGTPLYVDQTNNRVGIGESSPSFPLDISGSDFVGIHYERSSTNSPALRLSNATTGDLVQVEGSNSGDFIFKNGAGTLSETMRIDSDGRVGIGGTPNARNLEIIDTNPTLAILSDTTTDSSQLLFGDSADDNVGRIFYDHTNDFMRFDTGATERMRIDSDGDIIANAEGGSSNTTSLRQGAAKVWANINQNSGTTPDSFNVTSFTDVSAGRLTVTINNNMDSGAYVVTTSFYSTTGDSNVLKVDAAPAAGNYTLQGGEYQNGATNVARDFQRAFSSVHGDLA